MNWTKTEYQMPVPGQKLLVYGVNASGRKRRLRARWLPKHFEEDDNNSFEGDCDYDEEKDKYYWPEGWYESNEFEDTNWRIDFKITHWMPLPNYPDE